MDNVSTKRSAFNVQVYILDKYFNFLPMGEVGEIYFSGACITRGYLDKLETTAEKFLPNPYLLDSLFCEGGYIESIDTMQQIQQLKSQAVNKNVVRRDFKLPTKEELLKICTNLDKDLLYQVKNFLLKCNNILYNSFARYIIESLNYQFKSCGLTIDVLQKLLEIKNFHNKKFMDLGFGDASVLQILKKRGAQTIGIDFNPFFVQNARQMGHKAFLSRIDLETCDFPIELTSMKEGMDFVLSTLTLDRVEKPKQLIKNMFYLLKNGGKFAFQTTLPISGVDSGIVDEPIIYTPHNERICLSSNLQVNKEALIYLLYKEGARQIKVYNIPYAVKSGDGFQEYKLWSFVGIKDPQTNPSFLTDFNRMYRTGHLARYLPNGNIEFLEHFDRGRI